MAIVTGILIALHLAASAIVLVGALRQLPQVSQRTAVVPEWVFHGSAIMFLTAILVVVTGAAGGAPVNTLQLFAKLAVLIALSLVAVLNRRKRGVSAGVFIALAVLAVLSAVLTLLF